MRLPNPFSEIDRIEPFFLHHLGADEVVALVQIHGADTAGRPAHGANVVFLEADGLALVRAQENVVLAVGQPRGQQLVAFVER